jgi:alpha-beta hydrolase superfamily lysophospholipase
MNPSIGYLLVGDEDSVTTVFTKITPFRALKWLIVPVLLAAIGVVACSGQPLEPWHTERLSEEYTVKMADEVDTFEDYLALEERLFQELYDDVYAEVPTGPEFALVRYSSGSLSDPRTRDPDYNRTFEWTVDNPRGGVLLLHGLTDSPYSLRALGKTLHEQGFWVIGLRLPGHGTAPSGLKYVRWQDMAAAAQLAFQHLIEQVGETPVHIAGYSNGATLALDLAIEALDDPARPMPASLILVSPSIGITAAAALAGPTASLGRVPGFSRVGWTQTTPEFDPYKYNSFPANGGAQVHKLTRSVASRISSTASSGKAQHLPPMLVFKSAVDATVSTDALVDRLLSQLPDNGNELVLFDINRSAVASVLLVSDPGPFTKRLFADPSLPFGITFITNDNDTSISIVQRYKPPYSAEVSKVSDLDLEWPRGIISLSHVALPFPPDDPLYGAIRPESRNELHLGQIAIRGERGLMVLSSDWLLRLRHNPFYQVLEERVLDWVSVENQ